MGPGPLSDVSHRGRCQEAPGRSAPLPEQAARRAARPRRPEKRSAAPVSPQELRKQIVVVSCAERRCVIRWGGKALFKKTDRAITALLSWASASFPPKKRSCEVGTHVQGSDVEASPPIGLLL